MSVNWNPGNSPSWCSLNGGSTPATDQGVVVITDDSSENLSTFFKSELPSLPENQTAYLLVPDADETGGILSSLRQAIIELVPEVDAAKLRQEIPISWVPTIKRLESNVVTDRFILVDNLDKILDASKRERRAFIRVLEQFASLPHCGVVAAVTHESGLSIARLMGLIEPSPKAKVTRESHHTRERTRPRWEIARFKAVDSLEEIRDSPSLQPATKSNRLGLAIGAATALTIGVGLTYIWQSLPTEENTSAFEVTFAPTPRIEQPAPEPERTTIAELIPEPEPVPETAIAPKIAAAPPVINQPVEPLPAFKLGPENYDSISGSVVKELPPAIIRPLEVAARAPEPIKTEEPKEIGDMNVTAKNGEIDFSPRIGTPENDVLYFVAETHFFGHGMKEDPIKGLDLLKKASKKGSEKAANLLGTCYSVGKNVDQNFDEAHRFYDQAIDLGSIHAYGNLGVLVLKGQGCEQDAVRARKLFLKGASLGDPVSTFYAARCYERGIGTDAEDPEKARDFYIAAAALGNAEAIAWCKEKGILLAE